jgi:tetratricopeptide (TPR) repeat protein
MAIVFATYWNTLPGEFVYDDHEQIVENTWIADSKYLPSIFSSHSFGFAKGKELGTTYRPLVFSVYMAEYSFFGLDPKGWHLVNVLFHAINSVLVFFVTSLLLKNNGGGGAFHPFPAFAAAALFALHPVNSEVVSWVGCVPELTYTFLSLGAFFLYLRSRSTVKLPYLLLWASALLFFAALFAKETAISLPILVFVHDRLQPGREPLLSPGSIKKYLPYALLTVLYFIIRLSAMGGMAPRSNMYPFLSWDQYVLNACTLFVKYLRVLVIPINDYPFQILDPVFSIAEPRAFISIALIASLIPVFLILRKRVNPLFWLAAAFIFLPILPALYLPGLSRAPFADRYLYLPSMGFALMLAMLLKNALLRAEASGNNMRRAAVSIFLILAVVYALGSGYRNMRWRDDFSLWRSSLEGASNNYYAVYQLGTAALRKDMHDKAIYNLREAIRLTSANKYPDTGLIGDAHLNLAYAYRQKGSLEEAAAEYVEILRSYPEHAVSNYELASIYMELGRLDDAAEYFERSARFFKDPLDVRDALMGRGNSQAKKGDFNEAVLSYEEALRITPGDPAVLRNLSVIKRLSENR